MRAVFLLFIVPSSSSFICTHFLSFLSSIKHVHTCGHASVCAHTEWNFCGIHISCPETQGNGRGHSLSADSLCLRWTLPYPLSLV
jgi:hypothetical protein